MLHEVDKIIIRKRHRKVDQSKVEALAKSIDETGLISPIIINQSNLVAGAHRLAAVKMLGWKHVQVSPMGDMNDEETLELIEIDENLFRNELSDDEKNHHLARRVEIIVKRKLPGKIKDKIKADKGKVRELSGKAKTELLKGTDLCNNNTNLSQKQKRVVKGAEAEAKKEAVAEIAEITGKHASNIQRMVKTSNTLDEIGIPVNEREELTGAQLNKIAVTANREGVEAAKEELKYQKDKPAKKTVNRGDEAIKQDVTVLVSARSIAKKYKDGSELSDTYIEDYIESATALIEYLRAKVK